ncbi:MAG: PD-(D/E)XK nuclease family protein [Mycobacteriaceae bacterium]
MNTAEHQRDLADEELARSAWVGTLAHRLIAELLAHPKSETEATAERLTARHRAQLADHLLGEHRIENRAHRQTLLAAADNYFRYLLPPGDWTFVASERPLPPGRVDLLWATANGDLLVDEIKTGRFDTSTSATVQQCHGYAEAAVKHFGSSFMGIRVISVRDPPTSWLLRPDGQRQPLSGSGLLQVEHLPRPLRLRPTSGPSGRPVR